MPHLGTAVTPHDAALAPQGMPQELALATTLLAHLEEITRTMEALHQEVVLLREDLRRTPQRRRQRPATTPQGDAAPVPQSGASTPQDTPQVVRHAAAAPRSRSATPERPADLPPHVQRIAEVAAQYDKLSLAELSALLYTRNIYRATDRATGVDKPVNRGTLKKWLDQARAAGLL
jgi:hypothetical protein